MTISSGIKSAGWYLMLFAVIGVSAHALSMGFAPATRGGLWRTWG